MFDRKIKQNVGTLNRDLLHRIDAINDVAEYSPYNTITKETISNEEMFDSNDYKEEYEEVGSINGGLLIILSVISIVTVVVIVKFIVFS